MQSQSNSPIGRTFAMGAASCLVLFLRMASSTAAEKVVHAFDGGNGEMPAAGLIADQDGNLYGTTAGGWGTVYEVKPDGKAQVLYAFQGGNDGQAPYGSLLLDGSGNLFGTTSVGGGAGCLGAGCGTVFSLTPNGKEKVLYVFKGQGDGWNPLSNLVEDANGDLFGTTADGGNYGGNCGTYGCGTVFELPAKGSLKTLHAFQGGGDGAGPLGGVVFDGTGNLYGTTSFGGDCGVTGGCGTVFKVTPDGGESVIYTFQGGADGYTPEAGLTQAAAGDFFGTTSHGGTRGAGVVFEVTSVGAETPVYSFQGGTDGQNPQATVILDGAGNLYGTTWVGGGRGKGCKKILFGNGCGTVFKVTPTGQETILYSFRKDYGQLPAAPLLLLNGVLYGTTTEGGKHNDGVVFRLTP